MPEPLIGRVNNYTLSKTHVIYLINAFGHCFHCITIMSLKLPLVPKSHNLLLQLRCTAYIGAIVALAVVQTLM